MDRLNTKIDMEKKLKTLLAFYTSGKFDEVITRTKPLLKKYPNIIALYNLLALAYNAIGKHKEGIFILEEAIKVESNNIHVLNNLGMIYSTMNHNELANKFLNKALKIKPDFFQANNNFANLLLKLNKAGDAIKLLKKKLNNESNNFIYNFTLGNAYQQSGDFINARSYFDKCLMLEPNNCAPDKAISLMTNYKEEKKHFEQMKDKINKKLSKEDAVLLNFSLGKAYEDLEDYKKSFKYLKIANDLKNNLTGYRKGKEDKLFKNIKSIFNNLKDAKINKNNFNKNVIFIVGMPRSGTSLVEQILSSHKGVYGAGELPFIGDLAQELIFNDNFEPKYKSFNDIKINDLNNLSEDYFKRLSTYNFSEKFIVDKAPINFKWIGLILKSIPNSKIIHCIRDPMDVCWSNYKNFFSSYKLDYSYNFENLANYYNLYKDLMNFWKEKFGNNIYNLEYEKITENPEEETKKLLDFCETGWDENCLFFYKNKKTVSTASLAQVRKPIYKTSVKKWEKYSEDIKLLENLLKKNID